MNEAYKIVFLNKFFEMEEQDTKIPNLDDANNILDNGLESNKTKIEKDIIPVKVIKRSTRRRLSENNKSILQSAIARKEKSFSEYSKPSKKITKQAKQKSPNEKKQDLLKANLSSSKKVDVTDKPILNKKQSESVDTLLTQSKNSESGLRRSQRTLSSDKDEATNKNENNVDRVQEFLNRHEIYSQTLKLCCCQENKEVFCETEMDSQFCSAIDTIDDKVIGCSRLIETANMLRPSTRIHFGVLCECHRLRLKKHNCCPTCGVYCTQGEFMECVNRHYFHKDCILSVEDKELCPHCGDFTRNIEVKITMHTSKNPVFLPVQKAYHTSAKMSFAKSPCDLERRNSDSDLDISTILSPNQLEMFTNTLDIDSCNESSLIDAMDEENLEKAIAILASGNVDVKTRLSDFDGGTFLHVAVLKNTLRFVHLFISLKVDLDILDDNQNTPLMLAIADHKNDVLKYLLKGESQLTVKGTDGMTVLHLAAKYGNLEACKLIISSSFCIQNYINVQDDGGWTPLVWACEHGHIDVVKYLVLRGADVNIRDVEHNVALHWTAFSGNSEIVDALLNFNSDINVLNVHGDTPLHISAREDNYNIVITLLARDADVFIINRNNETPLDCAPKDGRCFPAIALNVKFKTILPEDPRKFVLTNDISRGREPNPIQCYNDIDVEKEPKNYVYIRKNCVSSDNVKIDLKVSTLKSCSCEDKCVTSDCQCAQLSLKCWYDEEERLLPEFNFYDPPMIFECNDMCACNSILCTNRLVQKPLNQRLQLFRTKNKGWGVRTLNLIKKGGYVCEYVGEILTDTEADHREDDSYLFDLDNRETESFCIDAKFYGNFARFINHSCEPNLNPVKVFIDHHDLKFPRIALFAKREIAQMEELSFDYGDKFWLIKYKSFTCDCGTEDCRYSVESIGKTLEKYHLVEEKMQ